MPPNSQMEMLSNLISDETDAVIEFSLNGRPFSASFLTIVADWDMDQVAHSVMKCVIIIVVIIVADVIPPVFCWYSYILNYHNTHCIQILLEK